MCRKGISLCHLHAESTVKSFRQGVDANVDQALLLTRNWDCPLADIRVAKLFLWHGAQDRVMPAAPARLFAKALPTCQATIYPDIGHLSTLIIHASDILSALIV
jgi:pimeloyl-ACP methyl ester carboxylesterase